MPKCPVGESNLVMLVSIIINTLSYVCSEPISNDIELPTESGVSNVYVKPTEKVEEEEGFIDSIFGRGTQARIITSVSDWVTDKAKTNPGCVERFICESYKV